MVPPVAAPPPRLRTPTAVRQGRENQLSKKAGDGQRVEQPPRYATLSHPPRPFPLGRGASRPLSSGVQAARRFACFSCPLPVSVGAFQGRQGFASPSGVARVLAFGCGPRQPPLRPLTPSPLENPNPAALVGAADRNESPTPATIESLKGAYLVPAGRVFLAVAGRLRCRRGYPLSRRQKTR